jgi:hypothetical protein
MNIRNHRYEYDELMEISEEDKKKLDKTMAESTVKEKINVDLINDVLIRIRKKAYNI